MANLPPGDPKLVSQIVNHLKSQGLFDQFRRDCLADVDTKPAYQNLRQRVDSFVANHLANHTWSPHLNKNQLRNNIRQQVLKSGMLESGIDRIISQVVDPKINHTFRPQVEKVVQEFLAMLNNKEDANANTEQNEEKPESFISVPGSMPAVGPSTSVASDAMSILETISSLNQEATASRSLTETTNHKNIDKMSKKPPIQQSIDVEMEKDRSLEETLEIEKPISEVPVEVIEPVVKQEDSSDIPPPTEDVKIAVNEAIGSSQSKQIPNEDEEPRTKVLEKLDKKIEISEKTERKEARTEKRNECAKKSDEVVRVKEEKAIKEKENEPEPIKTVLPEKSSSKKTTDTIKEESLSVDSDVDAYTDMTVSSVHTSDLSSFDEESEEEDKVSDSTEEGEITSDDDKPESETEQSDGKTKSVRQSYVHKPYLYSKYHSDSDDEMTVEQRRQSVAKEKEDRLWRRQMKRERLEEKRKQKAAEKTKISKAKSQGKSGAEHQSSKDVKPKSASIKEVLKEQMFLEKKVAMNKKKHSISSRSDKNCLKLKCEVLDEDSKDEQKTSESHEKTTLLTKESKHNTGRGDNTKSSRKVLELGEECKSESRSEREYKKKTSALVDKGQQDSDSRDARKQLEKLDSNNEDQQKSKNGNKTDKPPKKESSDSETHSTKNILKKEPKPYRNERERTFSEDRLSSKDDRSSSKDDRSSSKDDRSSSKDDRSSSKDDRSSSKDDRSSSKNRYKTDNVHKGSDDSDPQKSKKNLKDDNMHKRSQSKSSSEERSDRKIKHRTDGKSSIYSRDGKTSATDHSNRSDESARRDSNKRERHQSTEKSRTDHRYKRSVSDSRTHRESPSSSWQHSVSHKKSKISSEDKNETDSVNSDNSKHEDSTHKDKKRTHSSSEERVSAKAKSKSSSKSLKLSDQEESTKKTEKEKGLAENYHEKHRKSKPEDKDSEEKNGSVSGLTSNTATKETGQKPKLSGDKAKESSRGDNKERSSSKSDKKYLLESAKGIISKHFHKDLKRKEEGSKSEEKVSKHVGEKRTQERHSTSDRKSSRKSTSECKGESSKTAIAKKGSKLENDSEGFSPARVVAKAITSTATREAKLSSSSKAELPCDSTKSGKLSDESEKQISEPVTVETLHASNTHDSISSSEPKATDTDNAVTHEAKLEPSQSMHDTLSNVCKNLTKILPTLDSCTSVLLEEDKSKHLITTPFNPDGTECQPYPNSANAATSNDRTNNSEISQFSRTDSSSHHNTVCVDASHISAIEKPAVDHTDSAVVPSASDHSRLSHTNVLSEITGSNDGEISTTGKEERDRFQEETVTTESMSLRTALVDFSEGDNLVTGNDVDEDSVMDKAVAESNVKNDAAGNSLSLNVEEKSVITRTEGNAESTIVETSAGKDTVVAVLSEVDKTHVPSPSIVRDNSEIDQEGAATSSCSVLENAKNESVSENICSNIIGENAATSSNTPLGNAMDTNISGNLIIGLDNRMDCTASTSADAGSFTEDDADVTMLSENSFEDASSSTTRSSEKKLENAATSSQNVAHFTLIEEDAMGNITMKAVSSSNGNSSTENNQKNAPTSSDSVTKNGDLQVVSDVLTHAASSSDNPVENDNSLRVSENVLMHAATSSDNTVGDESSLCENVMANTATSSDNAVKNDGAFGMSENVITNAATSSNSVAENDGTPEVYENTTHAASSSDSAAEKYRGHGISEALNMLTNPATSSDNTEENYGTLQVSENVITNAASSSDNPSENGVLQASENVVRHAAASSSSVIDSSRESNFEGSMVSSEIDSENAAASSSNVMDGIVAENSDTWLKNPVERENENAASSSSSLTRDLRNPHEHLDFVNLEDSKNASATSSTQQDSVVSEQYVNVLSSGDCKEYPITFSDATDSSTEVSFSAISETESGSTARCSSSGRNQNNEDENYTAQTKEKDNTASSSSTMDNGIKDICVDTLVPSQNGSPEAASSSSYSMGSCTQITSHKSTLSLDNIEATASSSLMTNRSSEQIDATSLACQGNSNDNAATSSSSVTDSGAKAVLISFQSNKALATASSSVVMDSSTGGDQDTSCTAETESRTNTATSSSTLMISVHKEQEVGNFNEKERVTASSSTILGSCSKEKAEAIVCPDKVSENAATSSNMMDSSTEKSEINKDVSNNNTPYATTSSSNESSRGNKIIEGLNISCDINSEATAASSSNTMEFSSDGVGGNATSSDYTLNHGIERDNVSQTTHQNKNEEAASSSSLFNGMRFLEVKPEDSVGSQTVEDATTSSSSERENEPVVSGRILTSNIESNESNSGAIEAAVESSFAGSQRDFPGTSGEAVLSLPGTSVNEEAAFSLINSDDGVNLNYERTDEKEDAVSSASSEEHRVFSNGSRQNILQAGDVEFDGAVTSAGAEVSESSTTNENSEAFGHVTCEHAGGTVDDSSILDSPVEEEAVSHTSGADIPETIAINRAAEDSESFALFDNLHCETGAEQDSERPVHKSVLEEGEGAVTSTGITEENYGEKERQNVREGELSCTGAETDCQVMNRQGPRDCTDDDESAITSTGAKEDEEEGEGFVTSTGTASEDSSFSSGTEENSSSAAIRCVEKNTQNVGIYIQVENKEQDIKQTGTEEMTESAISLTSAQILQNNMATKSTENNEPPQSSVANDTSSSCNILSTSENQLLTLEQEERKRSTDVNITDPEHQAEKTEEDGESTEMVISVNDGISSVLKQVESPMTVVTGNECLLTSVSEPELMNIPEDNLDKVEADVEEASNIYVVVSKEGSEKYNTSVVVEEDYVNPKEQSLPKDKDSSSIPESENVLKDCEHFADQSASELSNSVGSPKTHGGGSIEVEAESHTSTELCEDDISLSGGGVGTAPAIKEDVEESRHQKTEDAKEMEKVCKEERTEIETDSVESKSANSASYETNPGTFDTSSAVEELSNQKVEDLKEKPKIVQEEDRGREKVSERGAAEDLPKEEVEAVTSEEEVVQVESFKESRTECEISANSEPKEPTPVEDFSSTNEGTETEAPVPNTREEQQTGTGNKEAFIHQHKTDETSQTERPDKEEGTRQQRDSSGEAQKEENSEEVEHSESVKGMQPKTKEIVLSKVQAPASEHSELEIESRDQSSEETEEQTTQTKRSRGRKSLEKPKGPNSLNEKPDKEEFTKQRRDSSSDAEKGPTSKEAEQSKSGKGKRPKKELTLRKDQTPESEQETASHDQSSGETEESTPIQAKRTTGHKQLEKHKETTTKAEHKEENEEECKPKVETEKRKRGRPPKKRDPPTNPDTGSTSKEDSKGESHPRTKHEAKEDDGVKKDTRVMERAEKGHRKLDMGSGEKRLEAVQRQGRKSKHLHSSSENESSEPESKRKRSESEKDEKDEETEEEEEEDEHKGATTRAASRLEAQRNQPHKPTTRAASKLVGPEPRSRERTSSESKASRTTHSRAKLQQASGTKRRREMSPPSVRTRGPQASEELPTKRMKR